MKKVTILLNMALFSGVSLYSMEQALSCVNNKMSAMVHYFKPLQQNYGDQIPLEVQGIIIKNIFKFVEQKKCINQNILEEYVFKLEIPLDLGCKFIGEFVQIQKMCKSPIGSKTFLPHELFCLSKNERDVFIRMANRPFIEGGNIDNADYAILTKMSQPDLIKGLRLRVLPDNKVVKLCENVKHIGVAGIAVGVPSMVFCLVPRGSLLSQGLMIMSVVGIFGGYGLALSAEGALYLYNKYYCTDKVEYRTL